MEKSIKTLVFSCILIYIFAISNAQPCPNHIFTRSVSFTRCNDLPVLNSFLHWNYHPSNGTVDIAYRQPAVDSNRWVAWALNVDGSGMLGAQALVALVNSSGIVHAYTSPISRNYNTATLAEGALSFNVTRIEAEFDNNNSEMIIFATLELPSNRTTFNHVWQEGPVSGGSPGRHIITGNNVRSSGSVNFLSDMNINTDTSGGGIIIPRLKRKNVHGVLNVISWGILMPLGAIIARYLKVFKSADPAWFYLHITCQSSAYAIGIAGWITGLMLGSDSVGLTYNIHRNIGITLFCLGTLQVFALLLRPNKDHKYRLFWNIYHHSTGYTVIILSIVNIFRGFDMLVPDKKWKNAYIGILISLGVTAAVWEAYTWYIVIKRKKSASQNHPQGTNGTNGVNGYGNKSQQDV